MDKQTNNTFAGLQLASLQKFSLCTATGTFLLLLGQIKYGQIKKFQKFNLILTLSILKA